MSSSTKYVYVNLMLQFSWHDLQNINVRSNAYEPLTTIFAITCSTILAKKKKHDNINLKKIHKYDQIIHYHHQVHLARAFLAFLFAKTF